MAAVAVNEALGGLAPRAGAIGWNKTRRPPVARHQPHKINQFAFKQHASGHTAITIYGDATTNNNEEEEDPAMRLGARQPFEMPVVLHLDDAVQDSPTTQAAANGIEPTPSPSPRLRRPASRGTGTPLRRRSSTNKQPSTSTPDANATPAPAATSTPSQESASVNRSLVFVSIARARQKLGRSKSKLPLPFQTESAQTNAPTKLFFQQPEDDEDTAKRRSRGAKSKDKGATAERTASFQQRRQGDDDGGRPPNSQQDAPGDGGHEKIGQLSREESEFDFAILLKPSKHEQLLDIYLEETEDHETKTSPAAPLQTGTGQDGAEYGVVTAPATKTAQLLKKKDPQRARNLLIQRITRTGLQVKRLLSLDGKQTLLKVKAPQHLLELGAEQMKLKKLRKYDQIWMEFTRELRETFAEYDAVLGGVRFIDSEKQSIVHTLLTSDVPHGAGLNEACALKAKYVLQMFPLHKQDLTRLRHEWITYWRAPAPTGTASPTLLRQSCCTTLDRLSSRALHQPIDHVAQYYGEKIAFHFAWMEMYTRWLVVPSGAGVILFILQVQSKTLDHPLAPVYAVFMAVWASAFLVAWKRQAARLAYRWGTLGYEDAEITRPEFYGDVVDSATGTKVYSTWKRCAKYFVTIPSVLTSITLLLWLTYYAFSTRDRLQNNTVAAQAAAQDLALNITTDLRHELTLENLKQLVALGMHWDFWFYFLITPVLYGLLIPILDFAFTMWARRMTDWENHPTETRYQSHLILKVFSFRFVHVFASLYYYAFVNESRRDNLLRVAVQLASFMIADQLWKNAMQTLYPFLKRKWQLQQKKRDTNAQFNQSPVFNAALVFASGGGGGARALRDGIMGRNAGPAVHRRGASVGDDDSDSTRSPIVVLQHNVNHNAVIHEQCVRLEQASDKAWEEADLETYDTFEDYTDMLIQFGYVTFFSLAFPLAPLLALVNNVFGLRATAFKLCHAKQRPIARKASDIGIWFHVLQLMSVLAVLTNCLHIAFTTTQIERLFPSIGATSKVWIVFGVEHLVLALKVWMMLVIPSTPTDVAEKVRLEREHAKHESARAIAAKMQQQKLDQAAASQPSDMPPMISDVARDSVLRSSILITTSVDNCDLSRTC
ncbi:TPA: hypothetical protein N0F65_012312 [Lagenidium giganteum]|uniref:Anoctamin transmembrane domain-containing protein n=1 Tax=Lagenidium giganteum TaxID=4803 RepID=A0AAV2YRK5_9STRA|nr:TPA: hypothetical protein N0F65_012312 [Lagenidium giganteum]